MNNVCLVGKLTRDPSVRFEAEHQTTTFTVLIAEPGREGATFRLYVPCIAWGKACHHITCRCGPVVAPTDMTSLVVEEQQRLGLR